MTPEVLVLGPADLPALEAFLARHADSSMFLRSNLRAAGIVNEGRVYQGTYLGARRDGALIGVVALAWNGKVVLQAPDGLEALVAAAATAIPGRPVSGFLGPWAQVVAARRALAMEDRPPALASREDLFALALDELVPPARLAELTCRRPEPAELPALYRWRHDYHVEALHATPGAELEESTRRDIDQACAAGTVWVLLDGGAPVAMTAFNARLPDSVQVGAVYTPPELRARGYARCAVAGSLLDARAAGAARAILFTGDDHVSARRAYEAIGFRVVGDYGIILYA